MKKILTKTLSLVLCIAFTGMQMSLAAVLSSNCLYGNTDVLKDAARITGHTAGLYNIKWTDETNKNEAKLYFNQNTRIDWSKLNVKSDQKLHFVNGKFGVLNNVTDGISTFAGTITAQQGKIVISNPNGILFNGGKFESMGGLLLTTQDLTNFNVTAATDFSNLNIGDIATGSGVIAVIGSSSIAAPEITITAGAVQVANSSLSAGYDSNDNPLTGTVLITADGANYSAVANKTINMDGTNVKFNVNNLHVANSAVSTNDGTITLVSGRNGLVMSTALEGKTVNAQAGKSVAEGGTAGSQLYFQDVVANAENTNLSGDMVRVYKNTPTSTSHYTGNLNVTDSYQNSSYGNSSSMFVLNSDVDGDLNVVTKNYGQLSGVNVQGNTTLSAPIGQYTTSSGAEAERGGSWVISNSTLGKAGESHDTTVNAPDGYVRFQGNNTVNGNLYVGSYSMNAGSYNSTTGLLAAGSLTVNGDLTANIFSTIGVSIPVVAKSIKMTSQESSIFGAISDNTTGSLTATDGDIELRADKGVILSLGGNVPSSGYSDYFYYMAIYDDDSHVTADVLQNGGKINMTSSNDIILNAEGRIGANVINAGRDVTATSTDNSVYVEGNIGRDVTATAAHQAELDNVNVGRNATLSGDVTQIRATNGSTKSQVAGKLTLNDTTLNSDYAKGSYVLDTNAGALEINGQNHVQVARSTVAGASDIDTTKGVVVLNNNTLGKAGEAHDTSVTANNGYVRFQGDNTVNGDLYVGSYSMNVGYYNPSTNGTLSTGSLTVAGDLTADIYSTIGFSVPVVAKSIKMTSQESSIFGAISDNTTGTLTATDGDIELSADKGVIISLGGNVPATGASDYYYYMALYDDDSHITSSVLQNGGLVTMTSSNDITLSAEGRIGANVLNAGRDVSATSTDNSVYVEGNIGRDVTVTAAHQANLKDVNVGRNATLNGDVTQVQASNKNNRSHIAGNLTLNDTVQNSDRTYGSYVLDTNVDGNLDVNSINNVQVTRTTVAGDTTVDATYGEVVLNNVDMAKTDVNSWGYTRVAGIDNFSDDLTITASSINLGSYNNTTAVVNGTGQVNVSGKLTGTADSTIGFSSAVKADEVEFTSTNSSIVQAYLGDTPLGSLTTDKLTVNAQYGAVAGLEATPVNATSDYYWAMHNDYVPTGSASDYKAMQVNTKTAGSDLELNIGGAINNIKTNNTTKTVAQGTGSNINDLKLTTAGDVDVKDITAVKRTGDTADKTGNVLVTTPGNAKIGNVTTDTDINVQAVNGTITVNGNLTADKEVNGRGDVILNGNKLAGSNFSSTNSATAIKGANVELTQIANADGNSMVMSNITAVGLDDNNGNVTILLPNAKDVDVKDIYATHDITLSNDPSIDLATDDRYNVTFDSVKLENIIADSEMNGRGDLNIKATGDIDAKNIGGANIRLTSTNGDVKVDGAKSARNENDTTGSAQASSTAAGTKSGNIIVTADNGDITIGNMKAASDIIGTANNGTVTVAGALAADAETAIGQVASDNSPVLSNTYGDVILSGKTLQGGADANTPAVLGSTGSIKGANVDLTQTTAVDDYTVSNVIASAVGNDSNGNVTINVPVKNITLTDISATKDIVVDNSPVSTIGLLDSAVLTNVIADSEENGIGDLYIRTKGDIDATNIGGANINLISDNGDITVNGAESHRGNQPDAAAGNIHINANGADKTITIGNIEADTDLVANAANGTIAQSGALTADNDNNGIGNLILNGKTLKGDNDKNLGDNGAIKGGNVIINQTGDGDLIVSNVTAQGYNDANGDNVNGDVAIYTPNGDVTVNNTKGSKDVTITTDNGKATVTNTSADSDNNGQGTLRINATGDVVASNDDGANIIVVTDGNIDADDLTAHAPGDENNGDIILTSNSGNIDLDGANADHSIVITPGRDADGKYTGDAKVNDAHADADNDKKGDLIINGRNVTVDADVTENPDGSKTVTPTGDKSTGNNVHINADNDVVAENINANDDIIINAGNDVTADNLIADANNPNTADSDGIGDLIINAGGDVDIDGGQGSNVIITSDNGDVTANDIHATGTDDNDDTPETKGEGDGNIKITADNGDVTLTDSDAYNDIIINVDGGRVITNNVTPDVDGNGVGQLYVDGEGTNPNPNPNNILNGLDQENIKNLLNLVQSGVDTQIAQSFTPIAFAAEDDDDDTVLKRIVKTVYKTPETGIVTITDRVTKSRQ